jgi:hypothetical protein
MDIQTFASSGTGDVFGLFFNSVQLVVPSGYVKNDPLFGESTCEDATFESLGLKIGGYTSTQGTDGRATDSFTLNVVPEPGMLALLRRPVS